MLWILKPITDWEPWYDKAFGFVVRAKTERHARHLAAQQCGDEGAAVWKDPAATSCQQLRPTGKAEMVLRDFSRA
jgi:hypothetical protein